MEQSQFAPPWWNMVSRKLASLLSDRVPGVGVTKVGPAVQGIMGLIYNRMKKMDGNDNIQINLESIENAVAFLTTLFIDICHDAGADNVILSKLKSRANTGFGAFKDYVGQIMFIDPGLKQEILSSDAITNAAPLLNNSVYMNSRRKWEVDEHMAFCETAELATRMTGNGELKVYYGDVLNLTSEEMLLNERECVFDQSSSGTIFQAMGSMGLHPVVSIANVADKGLEIQGNPTLPVNLGYVSDIFKYLSMKGTERRAVLGPSAFWMCQNDPMKDLPDDEAQSYSTMLPCSLKELESLYLSGQLNWLNLENLDGVGQVMFGKRGLLDTLQILNFFNEIDCKTSKENFYLMLKNNGIVDNKRSWNSTITVGDKILLNIKYDSVPEIISTDIISTVTFFDNQGMPFEKKGEVISATNARSRNNINDTIFKTIGDTNMFLYAFANNAWAMTGDRSAAAQYVLLSHLHASGKCSVMVNNQIIPPENKAKFIFESGKPSTNTIMMYGNVTNPNLTPYIRYIKETDYCRGMTINPVNGDRLPFSGQNYAFGLKKLLTSAKPVQADTMPTSMYGAPGEPSESRGFYNTNSVMTQNDSDEYNTADSAQPTPTPAPDSASGVGAANSNMTIENNGEVMAAETLAGMKRKRNNDFIRVESAMRNNRARKAARGLGRPSA